jgi:proteasome lid subunit RPN8/RPN11
VLETLLQPHDEAERCGLILVDDEVVELPNVANDPVIGFVIDPQQVLPYLTAGKISGTWHTHPNGPPTLSGEDMRSFLGWPKLTHHIIGRVNGQSVVRSYKIESGAVIECD